MRKTIIAIVILMMYHHIDAQVIKRSCGTEFIEDHLMAIDPDISRQYSESFRSFYESENNRSSTFPECRLIIPVHVVIVHPPGQSIGEGDNLSLEHIQSQIDVLNEDFGNYNSNAGNTPAQFSSEDTGIQFCLASVDPSGNETDGVTRYATNDVFDFGVFGTVYDTRIAIKKATEWDRQKYLNIWVAPTIGSDSDIIGFARVPVFSSHPDIDDDGVNIKTSVFGGPGFGTEAPYNMGRTTTHEIGHYFGLNHIATKNNTCSGDDGILDTPRQFRQNYGCPTHPSPSCGNNGDMFMNYMDYTDDDCMSAFTADQGAYMRELIYQLRPQLLETAHIACPDDVKIEVDVVSVTSVSCHDSKDGTIEVDACGGNNENYVYQIDGGPAEFNGTFYNITPGSHTITVTNDLGIKTDTVINVPAPEPVTVVFFDINHVSCNGQGDGSFSIDISGGTLMNGEEYMVSINNEPFTSTVDYSALEPGTYNIRVRDNNGCESKASIEITSPDPLQLKGVSTIDVDCHGASTGSITVEGQGGTPSYNYSRNGNVFSPESSFTGLPVGPVDLWIEDANGCVSGSTFFISEPDPLIVSAEEVNEISCSGANDAEVLVSATGGTGPYRYYLDEVLQSGALITGIGAGTFTVKVEDDNQCVTSTEIIVNNPPPLAIDSVKTVDVLCAGDETGSITIFASGGSEPYTYFIDGIPASDSVFLNLNENLYTISVQDAHQCEIVSETVIITNGNLKIREEAKVIPTCSYTEDGLIEVSGSGGAGIYTYSINGVDFQDSPVFSDLGVGIYNVRINDGEDCLASAIVDLRGPDPVELRSMDVLPPSCYGADDGMIDFEVQGGAGNYDYYLNGNYIEQDMVTGMTAGDYILEVTDGKGCRFETLISLPSDDEITIQLNEITPVDCSIDQLGTVHVSASGGSGELIYSIDENQSMDGHFQDMTGGDFTLLVTDEKGCYSTMDVNIPVNNGLEVEIFDINNERCDDRKDGSFSINVSGGNGPYRYYIDQEMVGGPEIEGLGAGVYDVYVEDVSSCAISTQVEILPANPIVLDNVGGTPPSCNNSSDGTLRVKASGGEGILRYSFQGRENATGVFPGVRGGSYEVTITDGNSCSETFNVTFNAPDRLRADDVEIISPSCYGYEDGSIYLKAGGGTGPKSILFNGDTIMEEILLDNLKAGNYRFNLRDKNNCTGRIDVFVEEPDEITILDTIIVMQNLNRRGSIEITVGGGTKPYLYSLDGGPQSTIPFFDDLIEGHYDINIEDANGCTLTSRINVLYDDRFENPPGSISDVLIGYERIQNETILSFIAHGEQRIKLYVFDANGRFVMYTEEFSLDGPNRLTIPASNFPSGIYIVRVDALRESEYLKFVKF